MSRINVWWEGHDNSRWRLLGDRRGPVSLRRPGGLVGHPERAYHRASTGVGVTVGATTSAEMTGELELVASASQSDSAGDVHEAFLRSWSTSRPGHLVVVDGARKLWRTPLLLDPAEPLDRSPQAGGAFAFTVPVVSLAGVWFGEVQEVSGSPVEVFNGGDLPMFPTIVWSGSGQWVTLPTGVTVQLPTVVGEYRLSTDPGTGFVVHGPNGVATGVRAAMRGLPVMGRTESMEATVWSMSAGVRLDHVERIYSPWR